MNFLRIPIIALIFFATDFAHASLFVLHGKVVQSDGGYTQAYLIIENDTIVSIQQEKPDILETTTLVETEGFIFPGLIDLHTHTTYNILPLWENAQSQFENRFSWRKNEHYRTQFRAAYRALTDPENGDRFKKSLLLFDELQAVAGGTTLVQESRALDKDIDEFTKQILIRGTDYSEDLGLNNGKRILSVIDLFDYRKTMPPVPTKALESFGKLRDKGRLQAYIPHLAEGRTGFLREHGYDDYSRREFEAFRNHPIFSDWETTPKLPIALVHCSGIDPQNDEHIEFLKRWNMGIIWSPVSNLLLYGDTLDVETLIRKGIPIALGSDWSPSGSKHVLDEARMARFYLRTINADVSDAAIFQMMTSASAKMIDHPRLGALKEGNLADLFILEDLEKNENPMNVLFDTPVENIKLVIVGGKAIYGERDLMSKFSEHIQNLPVLEGKSVENKTVYIDPLLDISIEKSLNDLETFLKEKFGIYRSNTLSSSDIKYQHRIVALRLMIREFFEKNGDKKGE
ncbi:MAG: amidohydrolase family protein [Deltaproteobacteria bacterium]